MNISNFFETLASIDVQDDGAKSRKEILKAMTSVGKKFAIASIPASIFTLFPKTSSAQTGSETPMLGLPCRGSVQSRGHKVYQYTK